MIDLHYWPTPNGKKVTILLEEAGIPYRIVPVNIGRGDQFTDVTRLWLRVHGFPRGPLRLARASVTPRSTRSSWAA